MPDIEDVIRELLLMKATINSNAEELHDIERLVNEINNRSSFLSQKNVSDLVDTIQHMNGYMDEATKVTVKMNLLWDWHNDIDAWRQGVDKSNIFITRLLFLILGVLPAAFLSVVFFILSSHK